MHQSQQNYNIHRKRADIKMSCIHKSKCKHFCIELEQSTSLNSIYIFIEGITLQKIEVMAFYMQTQYPHIYIYTFIKNLQKSTMQ